MKTFQITKVLSLVIILTFCTFTFASDIYHPVAHWTFDESSGTTVYDSAGSLNGTLMNGAARTAGKFGNALQLDGTNDYVEISGTNDTAIEFNRNSKFTISLWAQSTGYDSYGWMVCKLRAAGQSGTFGYVIDHDSLLSSFRFLVESSNKGYKMAATGNNSVNIGDWYHIVTVYDNNQMGIYLDGSLCATNTFTYNTGTTFPDKNMTIGAGSYDSTITNYYNGLIDDVRIYNYALNSGEVAELYTIPEPATVILLSLGAVWRRRRAA